MWHYHPVAALEALIAQEPTFVVDVGGERHDVERYEDVRDLVFDELGVPDDTPDLYELLMKPADREGVPDLNDFDARVWSSISQSEGCLKALNTYDTAYVTIGPVQQTLGIPHAKGELQGAMDTVRRSEPKAFREHVGRYGLDVMEPAVLGGAKKAYATLHGERLDSTGKRKLQSFRWVHRLSEAFGDPRFRDGMLREAFKRLSRMQRRTFTLRVSIEGEDEPHDLEATLGEIFRTDLAQALLLDTHVNMPGFVWSRGTTQNIWLEPVTRLLGSEGVRDLSSLTREQDLRLVALLLEARVASRMSDPVGRAIGILEYTENAVVEDLARAEDYSGPNPVPTYLDTELNVEEAEDVWESIRSFPRKVLTLTPEQP